MIIANVIRLRFYFDAVTGRIEQLGEDGDELGRHQLRPQFLHFGNITQEAHHIAQQSRLVGKCLHQMKKMIK